MKDLLRRYRRSLHLKLLVPILLTGLPLALAGGMGLYALFKDHAKGEMTRWAIQLANAVNYASESSPSTAELERFVTALGAEPDIREIVVAAGNPPQVIASTQMAWWRHPLAEVPEERVRAQLRRAIEEGTHSSWQQGGALLTAGVPLHIHRPKMDAARLSSGAVYIALDSRAELAAQKTHALLAALGLGAAVLLLTAIGYGVVRMRVVHPLRAIHRVMEYRRAGNLDAYVPVLSEDELGELAQATNQLLDAQDERTALYRQMFQRHPAIKLLVSPQGDGTIMDANQAAAHYYGYQVEELRGMPLGRINTLPASELRRNMARVKQEPEFRAQFQHVLADGEVRDVEVHSGPIQVSGQEYLYSIIHDVTEENRSRRQMEIYHQVFQNLPVGVFRNTPEPDGRFLELNPAMAQIFDAASTEELANHRVAALYQDPAEREAFSERLLEKGAIQREEVRLRSLKGRPIWAAVTAYRHTDPDGTVFFDGIVEDMTSRKEAESARDRLIEILEATPDFVSTSDLTGHTLYRNRGGWRMLGLDPDTSMEEASRPDVHPQWALRRIREEGIPTAIREGYWEGETALLDAEGGEVPVSQVIVAHYGPDGEAERVSTIMRDISERKAFEEALESNWQQLQDIANSLPGAVYQLEVGPDWELTFRFVSEGLRSLLGLGPDADISDPEVVFGTVHPEDSPGLHASIQEAVTNRSNWEYEARAQTPEGLKWIHGWAIPRPLDGERMVFNGVLIETTGRKKLEQELQRQATHDRLTDLFNRHHFEALLEDEVQRAGRYGGTFALVMFDIDHFKRINDTHGHPVGDRVLCNLADTVEDRLRQTDVLARWGGEEFLVLLPGTGLEGAAELAEQLRGAVAEEEIVPGIPATISLGVAEYQPGESRTSLLKRVDDALYLAKERGRNRVELAASEEDTDA